MPMRWLVLTVRSPSAETYALAEGLLALGATALEETDDGLRTWLPAPESVEEYLQVVKSRLEALSGALVQLDVVLQDDQDWLAEWKCGLGPRRVGAHLVVSPTWCETELQPAEISLIIDPQMAFGTGEHATTRCALRLLERALVGEDRVLDVGTGSGILAIAAAKLGAAWVDAVDDDEAATTNALENVATNGVAERVRVIHTRVEEGFLRAVQQQPYDLIIANVLSGVLQPLLPAFLHALRPGGSLILGGILTEEAAALRLAATRARFRIQLEDIEEGWWSAWLYSTVV
jgi:ribosomal protein L11 methyltransferase